ncbi:MAG: asparagine synthase (glutamine-hydrolyzing) [Gammaproteobacteria bacterium]
MCGVAGILNLTGKPVSPVILREMTNAIAHRGPDGEGHFSEGAIGLGHRRLAIIDLSAAGNQPMVSRDGRYVLVYNGEVYNYRELRIELESLGHQFHSKTDAEVVLNSYAEWGINAVEKFNGMFAFAIWDKENSELILVRDRYGIKPLYYTVKDGTFLFGSEIKAIINHSAYSVDVNKHALIEYFTFQNFFTNDTLFNGVSLLPAGSYLRVSSKSAIGTPKPYWDYHFVEPMDPACQEEYIEELDRLFQQAVNRQLVSDVEVGSYLSGGMDSGSITALAATQFPYMKTFTVGFDLSSASGVELAYDERSKAERMSYRFKTEHYEMVLKAGDMERAMRDLVWHLEEPRVGQSYPNYYAAKLASKFGKVVLSGAGGDELFAGYPWRYYRAVVNNDFEHYIEKYYKFWQRLISNSQLKDVFRPIWKEVNDVCTLDLMRDVFSNHSSELSDPEDYINHSLYFEAKTFLHGLLVVEDKLSMANSLETRVPFLDNDLVEFAMRVPAQYKLGNLGKVIQCDENELSKFYQRTRDGKMLLRKVMEKYIPKEVTEREKQGFSAPDGSWFRGESIRYVQEKLMTKDAQIYHYMDQKTIQEMVGEHLEGKINRRLLIWSLLNFEEWLDIFG